MTDIVWLVPWSAIEREESRVFYEKELRRELVPRDELYGRAARAIATRRDQDDVLYELDGGQVADVHLTWYPNSSPSCEIYESLSAWEELRMKPLHDGVIWD